MGSAGARRRWVRSQDLRKPLGSWVRHGLRGCLGGFALSGRAGVRALRPIRECVARFPNCHPRKPRGRCVALMGRANRACGSALRPVRECVAQTQSALPASRVRRGRRASGNALRPIRDSVAQTTPPTGSVHRMAARPIPRGAKRWCIFQEFCFKSCPCFCV